MVSVRPGLVVTGFVERVGDPVGMVAADGSMHRGELLVADALRELLYAVTDGPPPAQPVVVTHPAHWPRAAVDALRHALRHVPEWARTGQQPTVVSDAAAAISALQSDPGLPARGVIALCDFGGTGTSITLLDASRGYVPLGATVRHTDVSGDLIDQALLTHVIAELSPGVAADATGTSALGPLHRLRVECAAAKERLSGTTVTTLLAELPGFAGDVRLTRTELDEQIRRPLADFVGVLQDTLDRAGVHPADLVAVASIGGGARIPIVTTTLSEHFRVPVVSPPRPELAAAGGAALRAARGPADDRATAVAAAVAAPVTEASRAFADADAGSSTFRALAWSEAHDVPPLAPPAEPYDEPGLDSAETGLSSARPQLEFAGAGTLPADEPAPWYRRSSTLVGVVASVALLLATGAVVAFASSTSPESNTVPLAPSTTAQAPAAPAPAGEPVQGEPAQPQPQDPPRTVFVKPAPASQYQAPAPQQVVAPPPQQAVVVPQAAPPPEAPAPAPSPEAPPPPPVETTTVTATTQAPPVTTTVTAPAPTQTPEAPSSTQSPPTLTIPRLPSIPGVLNPAREH